MVDELLLVNLQIKKHAKLDVTPTANTLMALWMITHIGPDSISDGLKTLSSGDDNSSEIITRIKDIQAEMLITTYRYLQNYITNGDLTKLQDNDLELMAKVLEEKSDEIKRSSTLQLASLQRASLQMKRSK